MLSPKLDTHARDTITSGLLLSISVFVLSLWLHLLLATSFYFHVWPWSLFSIAPPSLYVKPMSLLLGTYSVSGVLSSLVAIMPVFMLSTSLNNFSFRVIVKNLK